ncbi:MAG: M20 family metallopeptidase [Deltaproteobacteria bacterium]
MKDLLDLTKNLIRFKSMLSRPEEIERCVDFIEQFLKAIGATCKRIECGGVPSIAALPQPDFAPVLLMSHIDVVDAPEELFEPVEKEGKLYGRGSVDDKYAAALSMVLFREHLQKARKEGKGQEDLPFGILITGDEEAGGHKGAKEALKAIRTDFCIALDGGNLRKIVTKEKGVLRLKLVSRGKAAHGSRPWLGENAIEKLFEDYQAIKGFFRDEDPEHWHKTINFSIIHAGKSANQVPDLAEAFFDVRYTEKDDVDTLVQQMRGKIKGVLSVEMKEPLFLGERSPYLDLLLEVSKGTTLGFEHGASDARFLQEHGTPGIVWGPNGDLSAHAYDEHVNLDSLYELYGTLDRFIGRANEVKGKL